MDPRRGKKVKAEDSSEILVADGDADPIGSVEADASDTDAVGAEIRRQLDLVPPIGTRWRWYDVPYRLFRWLLGGWRRQFIPWQLRLKLNNGLNFFNVFDNYERLKIEKRNDLFHNLVVPNDENVTQGAIWVVDFFPPSHSEDLIRSLKKNGWGDQKFMNSIDGSNADNIAKARRGAGFYWSRLGTVANPETRYFVFDAKREVLPPEFELIELTGVQLGTSMTAVVAFIRLSKFGQESLNRVWKANHEPIFEWRGLRRPYTEGRYFSAIRATQRERQRIHDLGRTWLARRCGGFFAHTEARQPVVDFNLFEKFDPTSQQSSKEMGEPLRALAMEGNYVYNFVSPQISGATLIPGEALRPPREPLHNCWGVVGRYQVFSDANETKGFGEKPYSVGTLAAMVNDAVRKFLLHDAVLQYVRQLREQSATQRDAARSKHRDFSPRRLDALKRDLLANSLDLPAVARDTGELWGERWRQWDGIEVIGVPAPGLDNSRPEFNMIEEMGQRRRELFETLIADDAAYRAVLATTSSLGASAASARLGRRALSVSLISLLVSATTLVTVNGSTVWDRIAGWLTSF